MKIEVWLINSKDPSEKESARWELPVIPRQGESITVKDTGRTYNVRTVAYELDEELLLTGKITVDAWSL